MNEFIEALSMEPNFATENGALAYRDTNSNLLNYFSNLNCLNSTYEEVSSSLNLCWNESPELTLKLIVYIRSITRKSSAHDLEVKGLGLKNEGRLALKWLYNNYPKVFHDNLWFFIEFGNWADLWHRDLIEWVDKEDKIIAGFIACNLDHGLTCKYLPRYKSSSNILKRNPGAATIKFHKTRNKGLNLIVEQIKLIDNNSNFSMKDLMRIKSQGGSHTWQQDISKGNYEGINFDKLPGKVLSWITKEDSENNNSSFLSRHNLEDKYLEWIDSKSSLNNTSYIYELIKPALETYLDWGHTNSLSKIKQYTIEKQIQTILDRAPDSKLNVMPVLDTSGSMSCNVANKNTTALDICLSLGVYFSMLQKGSFKDNVIAFDDESKLLRLSGNYLDRLRYITKQPDFMGSTNFQSVIDLIVLLRKNNPNIPIEHYPDVYLVISDMAFNPTDNSYCQYTNHEAALAKLNEVGLPRPIFIWYNVSPYGNSAYQNHKDQPGVMHLSGFDPSIVDKLMSLDFQLEFEEKYNKSIKDITPYESMIETLSQDYLNLLKI